MINGHSIECRVNAENPVTFRPLAREIGLRRSIRSAVGGSRGAARERGDGVRGASTQGAPAAGHDEARGGRRRAEVAIAGVALVLDCDGRALLARCGADRYLRPASGEGVELRGARRAAAPLRHRDDAGAACRRHCSLRAAGGDRAGRQLSRRGRRRSHGGGRPAMRFRALQRGAAIGCGSPATTIPIRRSGWAAVSAPRLPSAR